MNLLSFVLLAALGGFIRYAMEYYFPAVGPSAFPRATLIVNIAGAFLLGLVLALPGESQVILGIGFCGALTTFSGVSLQLHRRLTSKAYRAALNYTVALLAGGLAAGGAGIIIGRIIFS
ncbi:MAG: CrcB family protein [Candidatus Nanopelagicales bacterium]|jgi:fluoride exporter|nr:CrcB family protein [Candidatus Nanopelagicales bacterium]MDP4666488.1 CrcB family protein [Candidatus Nanopelagicales bacterium]MDP4896077.1 CrcB family protein [Candidatus Nanopelagicales bacterium]MDP5050263.1 CrcB family protein [Candidatus Nanopelagicales bacterium]